MDRGHIDMKHDMKGPTVWKFDIALESGLFVDDLPRRNCHCHSCSIAMRYCHLCSLPQGALYAAFKQTCSGSRMSIIEPFDILKNDGSSKGILAA